ncbi:MAG: hypothetical protein ACR2RF_13685 [Geminicoccaceae bacterium]
MPRRSPISLPAADITRQRGSSRIKDPAHSLHHGMKISEQHFDVMKIRRPEANLPMLFPDSHPMVRIFMQEPKIIEKPLFLPS